MLAVVDEVSPEDRARECLEKKVSAVDALGPVELHRELMTAAVA